MIAIDERLKHYTLSTGNYEILAFVLAHRVRNVARNIIIKDQWTKLVDILDRGGYRIFKRGVCGPEK